MTEWTMAAMAEKVAAWAPTLDWTDLLAAAAAGTLAWLAMSFGLRLTLARLRVLSARTQTRLDDGLLQMLSRTSGGLMVLVAVLVGVGMLPLDERWHGRVSQLWFAVAALQLGFWGQEGVTLLLRASQHRSPGDGALTASATVLGWALRSALWVVILLAVLSNLGVNITAFVASLGIGGIAVALAVQNILGDLFASLAIALDKPFEVGDSINVGAVSGTVEKVGLKTTRIRSVGGEQVVMANAELLRQTVSNFKRLQTRRVVFSFGITYQATPEQVAEVPQLLRQLIEQDQQLQFVRAHFKGFGESSLDFEAVYRVNDARYDVYMDRQQALCLSLMRTLRDRHIEFAFPTRTVNLVAPMDTPALATS